MQHFIVMRGMREAKCFLIYFGTNYLHINRHACVVGTTKDEKESGIQEPECIRLDYHIYPNFWILNSDS